MDIETQKTSCGGEEKGGMGGRCGSNNRLLSAVMLDLGPLTQSYTE